MVACVTIPGQLKKEHLASTQYFFVNFRSAPVMKQNTQSIDNNAIEILLEADGMSSIKALCSGVLRGVVLFVVISLGKRVVGEEHSAAGLGGVVRTRSMGRVATEHHYFPGRA
jgi:hypothetical protein